MKKIVLLFAVMFVSFLVIAQEKTEMRLDLKNGTSLTGMVQIQPDGSYLLETKSGDVFFFTAAEVSKAMTLMPSSALNLENGSDYFEGKIVEKRKGKIYMLSTGEELTQNDFMTYQGWEKYKKAHRQSKTGTILFISAGAATVVGALGGMIIGLSYGDFDFEYVAEGAAVGALFVGVPCIIGGVVFKMIGNKQLKKIEQTYNQTPGYVLDFGAQQNGIGFALKF